MSVLTIEQIPTLTDPVLIVAFAGWNDAGEAATSAVRFVPCAVPEAVRERAGCCTTRADVARVVSAASLADAVSPCM